MSAYRIFHEEILGCWRPQDPLLLLKIAVVYIWTNPLPFSSLYGRPPHTSLLRCLWIPFPGVCSVCRVRSVLSELSHANPPCLSEVASHVNAQSHSDSHSQLQKYIRKTRSWLELGLANPNSDSQSELEKVRKMRSVSIHKAATIHSDNTTSHKCV